MKDEYFQANFSRLLLHLILTGMILFSCSTSKLPHLNVRFDHARVLTKGNKLIVSTGKIERKYELTPSGFFTTSLKNLSQKQELLTTENAVGSDWEIIKESNANLISLTAKVDDDEKFTDKHICVEAKFEYPENHLMVKYLVWVYPDADGFRTQLQLKALP